MASTLTVKVHPVVYLTIVDAYERRSNKPGANDKALGTLMGFYEKNAIQVSRGTSDRNRDNSDSFSLLPFLRLFLLP